MDMGTVIWAVQVVPDTRAGPSYTEDAETDAVADTLPIGPSKAVDEGADMVRRPLPSGHSLS